MLRIRWVLCLLLVASARPATTQWADLGGSVTGKPAIVRNADGRLEVFVRGKDNSIGHIVQTSPGSSQWNSWSGLGGTFTSSPAAGVNADGTLEVFALGTDHAVWHARQTTAGGTSWSSWTPLGGSGADDPVVGVNADGRLEIFVHTTTNSLWHNWQAAPSGNWAGGDEIVGNVDRAPTIARNSDGRLILFAGDSDGKYWWTIQNTAGTDSWSSWWCLLGGTVSAPVIGTNADGRLQLFAVRDDNSVWTSSQTAAGGYSWSDWGPLNGAIAGAVAVAVDADGRLEILGRGKDNALWRNSQVSPGGAWSGWTSLGNTLASDPAAARDSNGLLQVFAASAGNSLLNIGQSSAGVWGQSGPPAISSTNAVIPVWRGNSAFGSNMYVSIYGSNLASVTQSWTNSFSGSTAPTSLGGVSVTVNNILAFIQYVSPTQINIATPDDTATGSVNVVVKNDAGSSNTGTATRARLSPTLLSDPQFSAGSTYYVVAQTPDFSKFVGPDGLVPVQSFVAAKPGDIVVIFATGCGPTTPATPAGVMAAQNSPLSLPYQFKVGGSPANVLFAGMVAGTVGLYQFNVAIPNVAAGDQPVELVVDGVPNAQNLVIRVGQ